MLLREGFIRRLWHFSEYLALTRLWVNKRRVSRDALSPGVS